MTRVGSRLRPPTSNHRPLGSTRHRLHEYMQRPSKIVCVGRNYVDHAKELGNEVPKEPLIFLKPPSSLIRSGESIRLPTVSKQVEYEGEIGVVIGARLRKASGAEALPPARRAIGRWEGIVGQVRDFYATVQEYL